MLSIFYVFVSKVRRIDPMALISIVPPCTVPKTLSSGLPAFLTLFSTGISSVFVLLVVLSFLFVVFLPLNYLPWSFLDQNCYYGYSVSFLLEHTFYMSRNATETFNAVSLGNKYCRKSNYAHFCFGYRALGDFLIVASLPPSYVDNWLHKSLSNILVWFFKIVVVFGVEFNRFSKFS